MAATHPDLQGYPDPRASFYSEYSPFEDVADDLTEFSDLTGSFEHLSVHHSPSRPVSAHRMPSIPITGKDFVLVSFKRDGDDWTSPFVDEIIAPQDELRKFLKKRDGKATAQLEKMGKSRRQRIQDIATDLTARDSGDTVWEPAFIKTLDETKTRDGKLSVKAFKVIFARRTRKAAPPMPKKANVGEKATGKQPAVSKAAPAAADKSKDAEKPRPTRRASALNNPFSSNFLFDPAGNPMDDRGAIPFANAGLPANIDAERPIGFQMPQPPPPLQQLPQSQPQLGPGPGPHHPHHPHHPQQRLEPIIQQVTGGIDGIVGLDGRPARRPVVAGDPEAVITVGEDPHHHWQHPTERRRSVSRHRRPSPVYRSHDSTFLRPHNRYSDHYQSSRSSWASEDDSVIQGEWDDLDSRTSEDTHGSYGRSPARKQYRAPPATGRYHRDSKYYRDGRIQVASSRPHRQAAIEARPDHSDRDELPRRRPSTSRPVVHQKSPSPVRHGIPPTAEYPSYYAHEQTQARTADEYMRNVILEEDARRERERERQREIEIGKTPAYRPGAGPRRYTFEPRDYHRSGY